MTQQHPMNRTPDAGTDSAPTANTAPLTALIVGASGFNGRALARRLTAGGHRVRGLVRNTATAPIGLDEVVRGDAVTGEGLQRALTGVDVAYYFVHSLDPGPGSTDERDVRAAHTFAATAAAEGVPRVVYLTTLAPPAGQAAPAYQHNRLSVEHIFRERIEGAVVLRCPMVLGSGSRALRPYVRLVHRLPVIPLGPWRHNRIAVVDAHTVAECLLAAATADATGSWDVPASAQPTHQQLVEQIADALGLRRTTLPLPVSNATIEARLIAAITGESYNFSRIFVTTNKFDYTVDPARRVPFPNIIPQSGAAAVSAAVLNWTDSPRYRN
ncbi:NAD(P)H-binding protein [Mycobacterium hubeiense]|uniref:NAD(P)H-binding protein n=1 Tax=Mycobacterium hubeiense TaxID=1867256 RepID=UPI000C7E8F50|nr:NAD(P)H-binding protein [Mycobacterium sp. QGD 101]